MRGKQVKRMRRVAKKYATEGKTNPNLISARSYKKPNATMVVNAHASEKAILQSAKKQFRTLSHFEKYDFVCGSVTI